MSDAPDKIYITKAHAETNTAIMKNCTVCKMYPTDIEYIHKDIADKQCADSYVEGYDKAIKI